MDRVRHIEGVSIRCSLDVILEIVDVHIRLLERLPGRKVEVPSHLVDRYLAVHIAPFIRLLLDLFAPVLPNTLLELVQVAAHAPPHVRVRLPDLVACVAAPVRCQRSGAVTAPALVPSRLHERKLCSLAVITEL